MDENRDLSGDLVKVVQYCIVSVVPGVCDDERVVVEPKVVAFGDDMTPEDFTAWVIAENCPAYPKGKADSHSKIPGKCWDRKYLRVAYSVMGRFSKADIDWEELQALSVAKIASRLPPYPPHPYPHPHPDGDDDAKAAAVAVAGKKAK